MKILTFLFLFLLVSACTKEDDSRDCYEPPTELLDFDEMGTYYLGFMLDGEPWQPARSTSEDGVLVDVFLPGSPSVEVTYWNYPNDEWSALVISGVRDIADKCGTNREHVSIHVAFPENSSSSFFATGSTITDYVNNATYKVDTSSSNNSIDISLFVPEESAYEGRFECDFINENGTDTIKIRDGRFKQS